MKVVHGFHHDKKFFPKGKVLDKKELESIKPEHMSELKAAGCFGNEHKGSPKGKKTLIDEQAEVQDDMPKGIDLIEE